MSSSRSHVPSRHVPRASALTCCAAAIATAALLHAQPPADTVESEVAASALDASTPLPRHPDLATGTLPNGLKYVIKDHKVPPGRVGLFLQIMSGSLNEMDEQRGLAHFLEHMAFNGSENFPPGELIPFFERIGLQFGVHQNAFTSFDRTVYMLDLPKNDLKTVEDGLLCLSDMGGRLLLLENEIDEERGVILEEHRTGLGAEMRIQEKLWPKVMPGARLPHRFPIGKPEVIQNAPREQFVNYYETWYRPENMTLFVIGDLATADALPLIEAKFDFEAKRPPQAPLPAGVQAYTTKMAAVVTDPEKTGCEVELLYLAPPQGSVTTVGDLRRDQIHTMASFAMNRRLERLVDEGKVPFRSGGAQVIPSILNAFSMGAANAECEPADWQVSLEALATEVKRAYQHGFNDQEIEDARATILAQADAFARQEGSIPASFLLQFLAQAASQGDTLSSARQRYEILQDLLPTITTDEVEAAFNAMFNPERMAFIVTTEEGADVPVPTEDAVLQAALNALQKDVTPFEVEERPENLLAALPEPGAIVESETAEDLGVTTGWLANGARFHYKFNDLQKEDVTVRIRLIGGVIEETAANRGITDAALAGYNQTATSTLTSTQITDLMTGKNVTVGAGAGQDTVMITVSGTPDDLEAGMQLAHLMLTDPIVETSAFDNWRKGMLESIEGRTYDAVPQLIEGLGEARTDDPRFALVSRENVETLDRESVEAWLRRIATTAPVEVTVVGDMAFEEVEPLLTRYVGSVARRPRQPSSDFAALREIEVKVGPVEIDKNFESMENQAMVFVAFRGADGDDVADKRLLNVASEILSTRMIKRIREEEQLVYSIGAQNSPADVYEGTGLFGAGSMTDEHKAAQLVEVAGGMLAEFAAQGPSTDEVNVAVNQILSQLRTDVEGPNYWLAALDLMTHRGRSLDEIRNVKEFYEGVNPEQVQAAAQKYFTPDRRITVRVLPVREEAAHEEQNGAADADVEAETTPPGR